MHRRPAWPALVDNAEEAAVAATGGSSVAASGGDALEHGERAELERLRAEVLDLRVRSAGRRRRRIGWRGSVASLRIVLGCGLAPVSVLSVWTANQVSDTSRYVANVAPLASDPAIQRALTDKNTTEITGHLHVVAYTNRAADALAGRGLSRVAVALRSFAPSISGAVAGVISSQVHKVVTSPAFPRLSTRLNHVAHAQLVKALSGQRGGAISGQNGQVTLGLGPFINEAKQRLAARGLTTVKKLPYINPPFPLFSAKYLVA